MILASLASPVWQIPSLREILTASDILLPEPVVMFEWVDEDDLEAAGDEVEVEDDDEDLSTALLWARGRRRS